MAIDWLTTEDAQRRVGRFAWAMAWVALVLGQLHALARHNTVDGKEDLALPLTRWWSDPARRTLRPLLDWADPDTVYLTYGKLWLPVFAAFTLGAVVVFRRRRADGLEKRVWLIVIGGYALGCVAVLADYWTQWTSIAPFMDGVFVALTIPAFFLILFGSTALGITLLAKGFRPRLPAMLLAAEIPLAMGILMFTSMGNAVLPVAFAFGILGRRLSRTTPQPEDAAAGPVPVTG